MSRPRPVPKSLVCSECGLAWSTHPKNPRRRDCIELLKNRSAPISIPWYTTNQVCNWGHYNCLIQHENWWVTYGGSTTGTFDASDINTTSISILPTPDDPDMGTPAKVS